MLPHKYRLPANLRLNNPQTYVTPFFVVKFTMNDSTVSRFGFVIGKAVAKDAVHRNRARRLLRSCIEDRLEDIQNGYDMLFLLKKGIIDSEKETLRTEIEIFLTRKNLLKALQTT